jgi:hypothetical protein
MVVIEEAGFKNQAAAFGEVRYIRIISVTRKVKYNNCGQHSEKTT